MDVDVEKLKYNKCGLKYTDGYRIVYFYDWLCRISPIIDEEDIPKFISIDDLLDRYLSDIKDANKVAIYKIDGTCISKKSRNNL